MQTHFITDTKGQKVSAIVPINEYEQMLEQLDELACIKAYDKAKLKKRPGYVPLKEAFKQVEKMHKK
jgi:hypothetical protein